MENPQIRDDMEFRLKLIERATTDTSIRLGEVMERLAMLESSDGETGVPGARPFDVKAEEISPFATGFYAKEADNDNRTYRWTGSADFFEFRFGVNRDLPWAFNMQIMTNPNVNLEHMRGFVDYAEIPIELDATGQYVSGTIPTKRFSKIITLSFYQPSRFVPHELDPASEDRRPLGIVFYRLSLRPCLSEVSL